MQEPHPWTAVVERLRKVQHSADPDIGARIARLLEEAEDPGKLDDIQFRTRAAHLVVAVDRITGGSLAVPPAVRSEVDRLTRPGSEQQQIGLTQRVELLEQFVVDRLTGTETTAQDGTPAQPGKISAASAVLSALADGAAALPPPPWQGVMRGLKARLASYEEAYADTRSTKLQQQAEGAADAALKALQSIRTGPGADVVRKISQEAAADPNGVAGVIAAMHPGGRHEALRNEFNAALARDKGFSSAHDQANTALSQYVTARDEVAQDYRARGWSVSDIDTRMAGKDRAILEAAEGVPGRQSGKSLTEELADRAMQLARELFERVREVIQTLSLRPAPAPQNHPSIPQSGYLV